MSYLRYWLWLVGCGGVASVRNAIVYDYFKSPEKAYSASAEEYKKIEGLTKKDIEAYQNKSLETAEKILKICESKSIKIVTIEDGDFPEPLKHVNPLPLLLFYMGTLPKQKQLLITIVGTRKMTEYGKAVAINLGYGLASNGITVVSGLARGIDTYAAAGALKSKHGLTIAILGSGIDYIYPPENRKLYNMIAQRGAVISEFLPGTRPEPHNFPVRNRLMAGLSMGTVIVESEIKGGSMITASLALEMGKDVFAVPGSVFNKQSEGTNLLIREQGAVLVTGAKDIIEEYTGQYNIKISDEGAKNTGGENEAVQKTQRKLITDNTQLKILDALCKKPLSISEIVDKTDIPANQVTYHITLLEMENYIRAIGGGLYKRI